MADEAVIGVVDDDAPVREALCSLLRSLSYRVVGFDSAADVLQSRHRGRLACLIADVQMPGMGGFELYGELLRAGQAIPTILITAYPNERDRRQMSQAGMLGYLTKPFSENDLLACLRPILAKREPQP